MGFFLFIIVFCVGFMALKYLDDKARAKVGSHDLAAGDLSSAVKTRWQMSQAAVVIQNLLEHYPKLGLADTGVLPSKTATQLVAAVWDEMSDIFEGKLAPKPHKLSIAAISLASGFFTYEKNRPMRVSLFWALGEIMREIETNAGAYNFHSLDEQLLRTANKALIEEGKKLEGTGILSSQ